MLNQQAEWSSIDDTARWIANLSKALDVSNDATLVDLEFFLQLLQQIRELVSELHFNPNSISTRKKVDRFSEDFISGLTLNYTQSQKFALRATMSSKVLGRTSSKSIDIIAGTVLHSFVCDLANNDLTEIRRCEGVYRKQRAASAANDLMKQYSYVQEAKWRNEIAVLSEETSDESATLLERCEDFYLPSIRSKYCSDTCRFKTFQIQKRLNDPSYLAEKQKRYRLKKSNSKSTDSERSSNPE